MSFSHKTEEFTPVLESSISTDDLPDNLPVLNLSRSETIHLPTLHTFQALEGVTNISNILETQNLRVFFETECFDFNGIQFSTADFEMKNSKKPKGLTEPDSPLGLDIHTEEFDKRPYNLLFSLVLPSEYDIHFFTKVSRWKLNYSDLQDNKEFELPALPLSSCLISDEHFFVEFLNHPPLIYFLPEEEKHFISQRKTTLFTSLQLFLLPDLIKLISSFLDPKFSSREITRLVTQVGLFNQAKKAEKTEDKKKISPQMAILS